jgi:hypothetical protein
MPVEDIAIKDNKDSQEQQTAKKEDQYIFLADSVPQLSPKHCPAHSTIGSPGSPLFWRLSRRCTYVALRWEISTSV